MKYNELADHFRKIIAYCNTLRDDLNIFMLLHVEAIEDNGIIVGYKSASVGKLLDKQYRPEESVTMTLFAKPQIDENGQYNYGLYTHKCLIDGVEIPAKTPEEMFEEDFIPNDFSIVVQKMNEYYE